MRTPRGGADDRFSTPDPRPPGTPSPTPLPLYRPKEQRPRPPLARWRIGLLVAVPVVVVPVLALKSPARLGPEGSAALFGTALAVAGAALIRGHVAVRVLVTALAAIVGIVGGFALWYFDRYPGKSELDSAIADVGVPSGFREDRSAREGCDGPIGCSTHATRSYAGAGTVETVMAEMVERLRRACYTDAAPVADAPEANALSGICRPRDIEMSVGVVQQGDEVMVSLYATPR